MHRSISVLCLLFCFAAQGLAQTVCTTGPALFNVPCSPVSAPVGNTIRKIGATGSISGQTLCTPAQCPAGLYSVHGYIVVTSPATLGTAQAQISYTDDAGATSQTIGPVISLTGATRVPVQATVQLDGTSGMTGAITISNLAGSVTYNAYLRVLQVVAF